MQTSRLNLLLWSHRMNFKSMVNPNKVKTTSEATSATAGMVKNCDHCVQCIHVHVSYVLLNWHKPKFCQWNLRMETLQLPSWPCKVQKLNPSENCMYHSFLINTSSAPSLKSRRFLPKQCYSVVSIVNVLLFLYYTSS